MAGMRPFVLCAKIDSAYYDSLAAAGCPSSQIAIVKLSAVPLWKVIVGPRADELQPDPQGSGFLFLVQATSYPTGSPTYRPLHACHPGG
jgi:hypothetical protein